MKQYCMQLPVMTAAQSLTILEQFEQHAATLTQVYTHADGSETVRFTVDSASVLPTVLMLENSNITIKEIV